MKIDATAFEGHPVIGAYCVNGPLWCLLIAHPCVLYTPRREAVRHAGAALVVDVPARRAADALAWLRRLAHTGWYASAPPNAQTALDIVDELYPIDRPTIPFETMGVSASTRINALRGLLIQPAWATLSNRSVAKLCGVSFNSVRALRNDMNLGPGTESIGPFDLAARHQITAGPRAFAHNPTEAHATL